MQESGPGLEAAQLWSMVQLLRGWGGAGYLGDAAASRSKVLHIENIDTKKNSDRRLDVGVYWHRNAMMPISGSEGNGDPRVQKVSLCAGG